MKKIAIMTDSNSGITQEKGKELGVCVLPMPFFINEKLYFEYITDDNRKNFTSIWKRMRTSPLPSRLRRM